MSATDILAALTSGGVVFAAELRPPRAELAASEGIDAWIDTYHGVRRLTSHGSYVFLTDSAVGAHEEDNLRHLVTNLGRDVRRDHVVPFLTTKHSLEYCVSYAERARQSGFPALVVLGGDRQVGATRCVDHAWQLREKLRAHDPGLTLGGWANPHADAEGQVDYLSAPNFNAEFYLTQVVSHHDMDRVCRFLDRARRRALGLPAIFGMFYYRSANPQTLRTLSGFLPVPVDALTREFAEGAPPEEVCARTVRALSEIGIRHFYISNLPVRRAQSVLTSIRERAGI